MKTDIHVWSYLAQLFLDWENFSGQFVEKIQTHKGHKINLFSEKRVVHDIM